MSQLLATGFSIHPSP